MKKILSILSVALLLVACGSKQEVEPIEEVKESVETKLVEEKIPFRTIEEEDSELDLGERIVVTEGKEGMRKVIYRVDNDKEVNDWTYEEPIHEVVKIGTKEEVKVVEAEVNSPNTSNGTTTTPNNTGGSSNKGGTVKPPASNGGGSNTQKPTEPAKPTAPVRLGQLGNSGMEFKSQEEGIAWAESIVMSEKSFEWGKKLGGAEVYGYAVVSVYWSNDTFTHTVEFKVGY